jgi:hypothetical protein
MIEKSKMILHERYCIRNLYRCKECDKVVEKKDKEEHDLEFHTPVPCVHCNKSQEKSKMEEHLKVCPKRPKECPYCEVEFKAEKFDEHIVLCGCKTTLCPKCNKYIQRKDWDVHQTLPCKPMEKPKELVNKVLLASNQLEQRRVKTKEQSNRRL